MVNVDGIKSSLQKELEASGVPASLASAAAQILTEENRKSLNNEPIPARTKEQQHIVSSAWEWMKAKEFFERNS
ncbi:hypothetical protein QT972_04760 [Microcoleus sp. herbarium7]|uniref:hypothetical protein n=1 Tax=Microcoleus sp. herbarium7 TaxID=3055435 RepID=UPI002FD56A52